MSNCQIYRRQLDDPYDLSTEDCGGDCLRCMAEIGDPDAVERMHDLGLPFNNRMEEGWDPLA